MKYFFCQLDRAFHFCAATGNHHTGCNEFFKTASSQFIANQTKELLVSGLNNLGQGLTRKPAWRAIANTLLIGLSAALLAVSAGWFLLRYSASLARAGHTRGCQPEPRHAGGSKRNQLICIGQATYTQ